MHDPPLVAFGGLGRFGILGGMTRGEKTFYVAAFVIAGILLALTDRGSAIFYGVGVLVFVLLGVAIYLSKKPTYNDGSADQ